LGLLSSEPAQARHIAVGLGICAGTSAGDFGLAVRFTARTPATDRFLERLDKDAHGEIDLRYTGPAFRLAGNAGAPWHQTRQRPLKIGSSLGHHAISAGTLGFFATHRPTGQLVIVSNNHVLANEDRASPGDAILQPASEDRGRPPADTVATLFRSWRLSPTGNTIDAAIAALVPHTAFDATGFGTSGSLVGLRDDPLEPGEEVMKVGRTTGATRGVVTAVEVDGYQFSYDTGMLGFDGQTEIVGVDDKPFSAGGDSGSLITDLDGRACGLLFGGSSSGGPNGQGLTYANDIHLVMAAFDLELALHDAGA
jgi:hypothetical protein